MAGSQHQLCGITEGRVEQSADAWTGTPIPGKEFDIRTLTMLVLGVSLLTVSRSEQITVIERSTKATWRIPLFLIPGRPVQVVSEAARQPADRSITSFFGDDRVCAVRYGYVNPPFAKT